MYLLIYYFCSENDNKCEILEESKRLSSSTSLESSPSRLSSPESSSSNSSTHVHYKKRVSRTFAESQSNIMSKYAKRIFYLEYELK